MRFFALLLAIVVALFVRPSPAEACGGFLAPRIPAGQTSIPDLRSDGSQVALLRNGRRTVVSLGMRYRGPPEDFALVVPVPVVLERTQVRTLGAEVFERLDILTRPRLVEQWEDDPCFEEIMQEFAADDREGGTGTRAKGEEGSSGAPSKPAVTIEAAFSVDAYDIVILGATDSMALETWLRDAGYALPSRIEPFLRPYVMAGSKFFVAKVDPRKIEMAWGRANLAPLQFQFDSEAFTLPIRLGLANVDGDQDLTVWVLGKTRYDVANYDNTNIPTNLRIVEGAPFAAFYDRLFRDTIAKHPRSVVTEYAGDASSCLDCGLEDDPMTMARELGATPTTSSTSTEALVVTRLHARYGATFTEDFFFRPAAPLQGGDERVANGDLPSAEAHLSSENRFQARYFIRHPWRDEIDCSHPAFGKWIGTPLGASRIAATIADDAPIDAWTFHGPDAHPKRSIYRRLDPLNAYEPLFALVVGIALAIAIAIVAWGAKRWGASWWKPALALLVLGVLPMLSTLNDRSWRSVREIPLPLLFAIAYVASSSAVVAIASARSAGRRVHALWFGAVSLVPLLAASLAFRLCVGRLDFQSVADEQAIRIFAEGEGEAAQGLVWAACAGALLLAVGAWTVIGSHDEAPKPLAIAKLAGALAAGAAANAFAYAPYPIALAVAAPFFVASAILAWRARRRAVDVDAAGLVLLGALLVAVAAWTVVRAGGLESVSGESVDPSQRARILDEAFRASRAIAWRGPIAAVFTVLPLALAAWPRLRWPGARELAPALLVLGACVAIWIASSARIAGLYASRVTAPDARASIAGVVPPELSSNEADGLRMDRDVQGPALIASGQLLLASPDPSTEPRPFDDALFARMAASTLRTPADPLLVLDRAITFARADVVLDPMLRRRHESFRLLLGTRGVRMPGTYGALYEGPDLRASVPLEWRRTIAVEASLPSDAKNRSIPGALAIRVDDRGDAIGSIPLFGAHGRYRRIASAHVASVKKSDTKLEPSYESLGRDRVREYVLSVSPDTTADALARLIVSLEDRPPPPALYMGMAHPIPDRAWEFAHPEVRFVVTTSRAPFLDETSP